MAAPLDERVSATAWDGSNDPVQSSPNQDRSRGPPEIALLKAQIKGVREIARRVGRHPGTVLVNCGAMRDQGRQAVYRAVVAQWKAHQATKRPKEVRLVHNDRLREYVQDRLAGNVRHPDGTIVPGPTTPPWKGLNKPHRQDRRRVDGAEPRADRAATEGRLPR